MTGTRVWLFVLFGLWAVLLIGGGAFVATRMLGGEAAPHYYSEAQARSGVIAFAQNCASCHGAELAGSVAAPPLVGDDFWEHWGGRPVDELYGYIQSKMPLGRGGSLSRETYLTATALVLWANALPAGEEPLLPDTESLLTREAQVERPVEIAPAAPGTPGLLGRFMGPARAEPTPVPPPLAPGDEADRETQADGEFELGAQVGEEGEDVLPQEPLATTQEPGVEGPPDGRPLGDTPEGEDGGVPAVEAARVSPADIEAATGDLRLSVFPSTAEVSIEALGEGNDIFREVDGGTRVVAGLPPGEYRIEAILDGRVLQQTVTVLVDEVLELEMRFPGADVLPQGAAPAAPLDAGDEIAGVTLDAEFLYVQNCLACHGPQGGGIYGPPLADNPRLEDPAWAIRRVLLGGLGMPSFHRTLVPAEIARVVSYVRTSFGNAYEPVTVERVLEVRDELQPQLPEVYGAALEDAPLGQRRYTQLCSACHGLEGGGDVGPPLAGNPALRNEQFVITTILYGRDVMPAFAHHSDLEIAAIASYIRTAWSNNYPPIPAAMVEVYRPEETYPYEPFSGEASQEGEESEAAPEDALPEDVIIEEQTPEDVIIEEQLPEDAFPGGASEED